MINKIIPYLGVFVIGFLSCMLFITFSTVGKEIPNALGFQSNANAPGDWIKQNSIHVYDNAVVIDVSGASISSYAATGSMKPTFDENSNGIRIVPKSENEIKVGDIISFQEGSDLIVHRVISTGTDSQGKYFVTQGDNNSANDGKIRFSQIKYVTIGVLY